MTYILFGSPNCFVYKVCLHHSCGVLTSSVGAILINKDGYDSHVELRLNGTEACEIKASDIETDDYG